MKNAPFVSVVRPSDQQRHRRQHAIGLPVERPADAGRHRSTRTPAARSIAVAQDFKSTRVQQFNLIVEKEFAGNVLGAGYIGSRGDRVLQNGGAAGADINLAPVGPGTVSPAPCVRGARAGSHRASTCSMSEVQNVVQRACSSCSSAAITPASRSTRTTRWRTTCGRGSAPWDAAVIERYDADNDVRHRIGFLVNYELPWGRDDDRRRETLRRGLADQCRRRVADAASRSTSPTRRRARTPVAPIGRISSATPSSRIRTIARFFNTGAFQAQPVNTIGDQIVPRNLLHGPSQKRLDMSLFKDVPLQGSARLQLRMEIYNVTNTPSFANPNGQLGNRGVRHDHQHDRHAEADAVRGEAAVLGVEALGVGLWALNSVGAAFRRPFFQTYDGVSCRTSTKSPSAPGFRRRRCRAY